MIKKLENFFKIFLIITTAYNQVADYNIIIEIRIFDFSERPKMSHYIH